MANPGAEQFIAALRRLEEHGDVEALAGLYADDARTTNPTDSRPHEGVEGARKFWLAYRASFERIHSRFHAALESDDRAMLEWTSECRTAAGVETTYDGVSVYETRGGKIVRFTAYFDPAELSARPHVGADVPAAVERADERRKPADAGAYGAVRGGTDVVDENAQPAP
jgi:ketosteroid isomerase-like protein